MSRLLLVAITLAYFVAPKASFADDPHPPAPHWIALAKDADAPSFYRATLTLPDDAEVDFADLFIAADQHAIVFLNGQRAGEARDFKQLAHFAVKKSLRGGKNVVAVQLTPGAKRQALLLSLHAVDGAGKSHWLVSDAKWKSADAIAKGDFSTPDFDDSAWKAPLDLGAVGVAPWGIPTTEVEHYHQWKQALNATTAVDPRTISVPEGYAVELIRSAGKDEGSWISLAFDERGRLVVGREDKGLLRLTLPEMPKRKLAGEEAASKIKVETINDTLLECRGLLFVGKDLYANANNSKGLYRLRDTDGDDTLDEVKLLREMPGNVGHGRNDLTLGPDGKLYLICGNDVFYPKEGQPGTSPFRNFAQDRLLPCEWNKNLFNSGTPAPGGYVVRTDLEGKSWDIIAGGFRNAYGIAFNADGEMFTYDADMEWDAGAPWYRPTRINHIVSGGDYGWRQGTDKWRAWYPDSLPSTLDIGLGSPTAVKFGDQSDFERKYRSTLFALDWAFGRIIAVDLEPQGASYTAKQATFVSGRPLNVCDLEFGQDGAMYFVTGGRRTQSGIYRVVWKGGADSTLQRPSSGATRKLGIELKDAWPHLYSNDPWLRHAARMVLEAHPVHSWRQKALQSGLEPLLALARVGNADDAKAIRARLIAVDGPNLSPKEQLQAFRTYQLTCTRHGRPDEKETAVARKFFETCYPANSLEANDLLCELLVYLGSPKVIERTLPLLDAAPTPEEKLHYLMCLRLVKSGWTLEQRKAYFTWLQRADAFPGAHYMPRFVAYIRQDAVATLSDDEKKELGALIEPAVNPAVAATAAARPFVKAWTLEDFAQELDRPRGNDAAARGKALFVAADCAKCHRIAGEGALVGPDLTGVGKRFSKKDLLLSVLEPSRAIDDKYKQKTVVTASGVTYTGQAVSDDAEGIALITDPTQPTRVTRIPRGEIDSVQPSPVSPMPAGALNTLSHEEVLLLLDYLSEAGKN